ncbi:hypothetical protein L6R46_22655 [Myxococcota bacterium]|nr:hypothetical protein [Myxococcota bacterium]
MSRGPRASGSAYLLPPGWGESIPHLREARAQESEASACLLTRDLPAAKQALQRAAEAASRASESLRKLSEELGEHDVDGKLPDWED